MLVAIVETDTLSESESDSLSLLLLPHALGASGGKKSSKDVFLAIVIEHLFAVLVPDSWFQKLVQIAHACSRGDRATYANAGRDHGSYGRSAQSAGRARLSPTTVGRTLQNDPQSMLITMILHHVTVM